MDSATEFLFGTSIGSLEQTTLPAYHLEFIHAFDYHFYRVFRRILLGSMIYLDRSRDDRRHGETSEIIRGFADVLINKALANQKRTDRNGDGEDATESTTKMQLFETFARSTKDRSEMRDHLLTILAAARDTTAAFLRSM
jgi:cytochrome P450